MKYKFALIASICAFLLFFTGFFSSCRNALDSETAEIAVFLPFGQQAREASASSSSYSYVVTFTDKNGEATELSGNSGDEIVLKPATPGNYEISGSAFDERGTLRYQGDCTAVAQTGKRTDVELTLHVLTESKSSKHISIEPVADGIKIQLKWLEGDGELEDWSGVTEINSKIKLDFYGNNVKPSAKNPLVEYLYPFTTSGETYEFVYSFQGTDYYEERVWCKASGGIGPVYDVDKWRKSKIVIDYNSATAEYSFKYDTSLSSVIISDKYSKFTDLRLDTQLWGGLSDFSEAQFISSHGLDLSTKLTEADALLSSTNFDFFGILAKYRIASYKTFFIQSTMKFMVAGCDTDFVSEGIATQVNYEGPAYTEKAVEGVEDKGNGWNIFYACFEKDYQKFKMINCDATSVEFSMSGEFDNDTYELQICKVLDTIVAGKKYAITFNLKCSEELESFEYDVFDKGIYITGNNLKYSDTTVPVAANTSIPVTLVVDSTNISGVASLSLIPFTSGSYSISDLNVTEVN